MSQLRLFLKYWLPVLLWMLVIFSASGDAASFHRSSRILGPLFRALFPGLSEDGVTILVTLVRKFAHAFEYAVLAGLLWRALRKPARLEQQRWTWTSAAWAFALATAYAITDEWHQLFVPGRQGSRWDVLIDTFGAALGILLLWGLWIWRRRRWAGS